jgi:LacI family transcriptional regulator, galactose operon repressor
VIAEILSDFAAAAILGGMPQPTLRIALACTFSLGYCRRVLRGIKQYAEQKPDWVLLPIDIEPAAVKTALRFHPAGFIAHVLSPPLADLLSRLRVPVVNICGVLPNLGFPRVGTDNLLIGRIAARYFLDRGFRNFGYVGQHNHDYSRQREAGFREMIEAAGHTAAHYHERPRPFDLMGRLWSLQKRFQDWVLALRKPAAVFTCNDLWGLQLTETCRQLGFSVPEDVAILGVQDDDLLCELARPSLSSIAIPAERIGFEAAAMLDRLLSRPRFMLKPLLFPPLGVVTRQSSDILAVSDRQVAAAVRFIQGRAHQALSVEDILEAVSISRRALERRFRKTFHRSLGEEIRRAHLERAKELLVRTSLGMAAVAQRSGFTDGKHLATVFRQEIGLTPTAYREQLRSDAVRLS